MSSFNYNKAISIYSAFDAYLRSHFPTTLDGITGSSTEVSVIFKTELSQEDQTLLHDLVEAYVNPSYWLDLDHTESAPLTSPPTNSSDLVVLQSIIVSSLSGNPNIVLANMKSIIRYSTQNPTYFQTWDPIEAPIIFTLEIYNYTTQSLVKTVSTNVTNEIQAWKTDNTAPDIFKTVQIYGLKDLIPNFDCIWLFKGSINNSNVYASMNGLQKLYYQLILPQ